MRWLELLVPRLWVALQLWGGWNDCWLTWSLPPPLLRTGDSRSIALLEGQLTWLVHIVGAIIRGRLSSSSAESQVRAPCPHAS